MHSMIVLQVCACVAHMCSQQCYELSRKHNRYIDNDNIFLYIVK